MLLSVRGSSRNPISTRIATTRNLRTRIRVTDASQVQLEGTNVRSATHWSDLKDPCHIWATGNKSVRVKNDYKDVSLEDYMRLPVSQYYVLDPRLITSRGDSTFEFSVPKLEFFNEWIKPSVVAKVSQSDKSVHIKTLEAEMNVSELIASLDLDQRWFMIFESTLTWDNDTGESDKQLRGLQRALVNGNGAPLRSGMIHGVSKVDVWSEMAPEFDFMNKQLLQNACNLALNTLMQSLLPIFMTQLSEDFTKWATDEDYRKERETWDLTRFN
eukprot:g259.t1